MENKLTFCIPTYGKKIRRKLIISRTLDSLARVKNKDKIRVIVFNTTEPYNESVNLDISKVVQKYKDFFEIILVTSLDLEHIKHTLLSKGFNGITEKINFKGYSNMRNSMLVVANILDSDVIIMIDDDEIVDDENFVDIALHNIGEKYKKGKLLGKTGYYIYDKTGYELKQQSPITRKLWLKETYINQTLSKYINSKHRLNNTTIAFGGIMVIHKRMYRKVPFDPYIHRGEDTDYVINARQFGFNFVIDNQLKIIHRPPKKHIKYWQKLRQDIYRFIYMREKLRYFNKVDIKSLEPYPAIFLKEDLEYRAAATSISYARRSLKNRKINNYKEYFENTRIVFTEARMHAVVNAPKYFEFQKNWASLMKEIPKIKKIKKSLDRF